ncbi:MAG: SPASM domain-containing protein [Patescibacteria group bacterium]
MNKVQEIYIANPFVVQIHLNKKCFLGCSYCYLRNIKDSYINTEHVKKFLANLNLLAKRHKFNLHINLTGGDLFFHPKIDQICQDIYHIPSVGSISLMVNTLWHKKAYKIVLALKDKLDAIQVNIDVISSRIDDVKFLKENNIKTVVKVMLAKNNDMNQQVEIAKKIQEINPGILVGVDRFCPQSAGDRKYMLSRQELVKAIKRLKKEFFLFITDDPLVESIINKPSDIVDIDQNVMRGCIIPNGGLAIFPDGKIKLCARIPQFETGFNIKNFNLIKYIQTFKHVSGMVKEKCAGCNFIQLCNGGCVATSYSLIDNFTRDAQCMKNNHYE